MLNIKNLLKKKGWTGRELGRLEMVNTLDVFRQSLEGVREPKPIISNTDFRKMLSTINEPLDERIYSGYIAIHKWFNGIYNGAIAQEQHAYLNFNTLIEIIGNAETAEDVYEYIAKLPLIMTEKQYKETIEKRKKEILHPNGEEISFNIFNLLEQALNFYIKLLHKEPRKKNPLKPLKKKLETELVEDHRILSMYNKITGNGYYTAPDGTRSDHVSHDEWQNLITSPSLISYLKNAEKMGEEKALSLDYYETFEKRVLTKASAIYNGATEEEANNKVEEVCPCDILPCEWHYYEEAPDDLNKWEILEAENLFEYYPALRGEGTDEEILEDMKAFINEFPTVVKAILTDIEQFIEGASSLPVEKWPTTCCTWEELYNVDFYGFRSTYINTDSAIFKDNRRALNGIAILRANDLMGRSPLIDKETGYYKEPEIINSLRHVSLERFFSDSEEYAEAVEKTERARRLFKKSYYYLLGYNKALDIIASYFDLEELKVAKISTENLETKAKCFNNIVALLYNRINDIDYTNEKLKAKKMEVLKNVFYPISLDDLVIPEDKIKKAKDDIKNFRAFYDEMLDVRLTLCYMDEDEKRN